MFRILKSDVHGLGVFSESFIEKGNIIGECQYSIIDDVTSLKYPLCKYLFTRYVGDAHIHILPLGFCLFINSSIDDNVRYEVSDESVIIISKRDIYSGEELFLYYDDYK